MTGRDFINPSLIEIRDKYNDYENQFKNIAKSWNARIRNFVTESMGVKLNYGNNNSNQVKVAFEPAQNESFFDLILFVAPIFFFNENP